MNTFIIETDLSTSRAEGKFNIVQMTIQFVVSLDQIVDTCYDKVMAFFSSTEYSHLWPNIGTGGSPDTYRKQEVRHGENEPSNTISKENTSQNTDKEAAHYDIHSVWKVNFML